VPSFKYLGRAKAGQKVTGSVEAANRVQAILLVEREGVVPIKMELVAYPPAGDASQEAAQFPPRQEADACNAGTNRGTDASGYAPTSGSQEAAACAEATSSFSRAPVQSGAGRSESGLKPGYEVPHLSSSPMRLAHFRRWWFVEQRRRRRLTWFFVILGVAWMAILGYLAVAAHVTLFAAVNPSFTISNAEARWWCVVGSGITVLLWGSFGAWFLWSAARVVPRLVGAQPANDDDSRLLANIVAETAIASGETNASGESGLHWYVLESPVCNAFAVGRSVLKGSIVVTRGLLSCLTRDELQAVMAHELAHLKNGDAMFVVQAMAFAYILLAGCMMATGMAVAIALLTAGLSYVVFKIGQGSGNVWVALVTSILAFVIRK
jgi:Zn-dependent protease with chaperone function